ncbi:MAG: M23 family metallopeptidase [Candidatus Abyssobacteria bacterium SURF_17]|uniref:M23 family metallopeptidase n=1 Tax=Candidatus Abyssobacteria bacterium SURF_17 TaxID=2093361 RepID=A0A419EW81_9BACT|nr:MAG: M23 family metallopeptidase [Candidatus Abyssubacteria bacterium SURF_17]
MQKKWSLMIVPNSPGRKVYNLDVSVRTLRTAAIVAASLFILTIIVTLYAGYKWKQDKLSRVLQLEAEISARDAEILQLNKEFSVLEELEDKLRTIAGLRPRERSKSDPAAGGQGGPFGERLSGDVPYIPSDGSYLEPAVQRSVQDLLNGSLELKDSFAEILDAFERQSARLASIPSLCPVASQDAWISSGFGYRKDPISGRESFHEGCDIVAPRGTPVIAPADGTVLFAGWQEGLGRAVIIEHGYGYQTTYGHNNTLFVKKGDAVKRGDLLAHVGSSGRSTGPHLHYEVHANGRLVNPQKYLVE